MRKADIRAGELYAHDSTPAASSRYHPQLALLLSDEPWVIVRGERVRAAGYPSASGRWYPALLAKPVSGLDLTSLAHLRYEPGFIAPEGTMLIRVKALGHLRPASELERVAQERAERHLQHELATTEREQVRLRCRVALDRVLATLPLTRGDGSPWGRSSVVTHFDVEVPYVTLSVELIERLADLAERA